jgi:8-oxo-dGTP diphosphatase
MISRNQRGDQFLEFTPREKIIINNKPLYRPLTHALAVVRHASGVLFVFNRARQVWELPGGMIGRDEHSHTACRREIEEESGQVVSLTFSGFMHFRLFPDGRTEYGALYSGVLDTIRPFTANDEIEKITFWDLAKEIGPVDPINRKLVDFG